MKKQQPTVGEFTKKTREIYVNDGPYFPTKNMFGKRIEELCDRLDAAEAINKELMEACEVGLSALEGISRITAELEAKGETFTKAKKDEHENNIKIIEAIIAKAKKGT